MGSNVAGIWKWLLGLLVVCNIALIAIIWFRSPMQQQDNGGRPPRNRQIMDFDKQLNLTKEQQEKFKTIVADQHHKIDSLKMLAKTARETFFANVSAANPDTAKQEQLSTELGMYHKQVELQTLSHFREIRAMLNDDQKKIFDNLIQNVLKHLPEQPRVKGDGLGQPYPRGREGDGPPPQGDDDHQGPPHGDDGQQSPPPRDGNCPPPPRQ